MPGHLFDPDADFSITGTFHPHWSQAGAIVFITMRLADSIPKDVLLRWERMKQEWLRQRGINGHWTDAVATLDAKQRSEFAKTFQRTRELYLDECHGSCVLEDPVHARIVAESLLHFDGDRYRMGDFVIMPNHVHLLAAFATEGAMRSQCDSWMHYTAWRINKHLSRAGKLWQQEPFDHLVRSNAQYAYLREYIRQNPIKARLPKGSCIYYHAPK